MSLFDKLDIDGSYLVIGILAGVLLLFILYIILIVQHLKLKKSYHMFMKGADGKTLEDAVMTRFKELEGLKIEAKELTANMKLISDNLLNAYQYVSLYKYDAFKEMGGKLSFSLCMLDAFYNGFILTSMHSSREGCYTYIKEVIQGESFVLLSNEEKQVLADAKSKRKLM